MRKAFKRFGQDHIRVVIPKARRLIKLNYSKITHLFERFTMYLNLIYFAYVQEYTPDCICSLKESKHKELADKKNK